MTHAQPGLHITGGYCAVTTVQSSVRVDTPTEYHFKKHLEPKSHFPKWQVLMIPIRSTAPWKTLPTAPVHSQGNPDVEQFVT